MGIFFFQFPFFLFNYFFEDPIIVVQKKIGRERERGYQHYQVVKSLRNWARAQERKAVRRGRLEGIMDGSDLTLEAASAAVITSSISNPKKKKKKKHREKQRETETETK